MMVEPVDIQTLAFDPGFAIAEVALLPGGVVVWRLDPEHPGTPDIASHLARADQLFIITDDQAALYRQCITEVKL